MPPPPPPIRRRAPDDRPATLRATPRRATGTRARRAIFVAFLRTRNLPPGGGRSVGLVVHFKSLCLEKGMMLGRLTHPGARLFVRRMSQKPNKDAASLLSISRAAANTKANVKPSAAEPAMKEPEPAVEAAASHFTAPFTSSAPPTPKPAPVV